MRAGLAAAAQEARLRQAQLEAERARALQQRLADQARQAEQARAKPAPAQAPRTLQAPARPVDAFEAPKPPAADPRLLGAAPPAPPPTPEQAATADAQRVNEAARAGAPQAAHQLSDLLLHNKDPKYQTALLEQSRGALQTIGNQLGSAEPSSVDDPVLIDTVNTLNDAASRTTPDGARIIAQELARTFPEANSIISPAAVVLKRSVDEGHGSVLTGQLINELQLAGKPQAANNVAANFRGSVEDARSDFETQKQKFDELNGRLAAITQDLQAAGRTEEELETVIKQFREEPGNAAVFSDYDRAATRLASTLGGASEVFAVPPPPDGKEPIALQQLRGEVTQALQHLPALAQTPAGSRLLGDAVEGRNRVLEVAPDVEQTLPEEQRKGWGDLVRTSTVQAASTRALEHIQANAPAQANSALDGLAKYTRLFRTDANTLSEVTTQLKAFSDVRSGQQLTGYLQRLDAVAKKLPDDAALSFKGGGAALGVVHLAAFAPGLSDANLNQQVQYALTAAGVGIQSGSVALSALNRVDDFQRFSAFARRAGPVLGTAVSALSAFDNFAQGKDVQGVGDLAFAAGSALLLSPGPGTAAGAILIAGGTALKLADDFLRGEGDGAAEQDTEAALKALNVPDDAARRLSDLERGRHYVGQVIGSESARLGIPPKQYLDWLVTLPPDRLQQYMDAARTVDADAQGKLVPTSVRDRKQGSYDVDPSTGTARRLPVFQPHSLRTLQLYLDDNGLVPPR